MRTKAGYYNTMEIGLNALILVVGIFILFVGCGELHALFDADKAKILISTLFLLLS
jgi:hypothetical protein